MTYKILKLGLFASLFVFASCQSKNNNRNRNTSRPGGAVMPTQPQRPLPPQNNFRPAPIPGKTACYKASIDICQIEVEILKKTNAYRAEQGREPLMLGEKLSFSSRDWSRIQAERRRIGHAGFSRDRMKAIEREYSNSSGVRMSSENVAMTSASRSSAERIASEFVDMWIKSRGHRRNILSRATVIGIGVYTSNGRSYYATQIFGSEGSDSSIAQTEIDPNNLVRNTLPRNNNQARPYTYGLGLYRH